MKKQELIKKLEEQVKIFKSRAIKGDADGKRHDLIRSDEKKMMQLAFKQLGWSCDKIGGYFNRDPKTVAKKVQESSEVKGPVPETAPSKVINETPEPKSAECVIGLKETGIVQKPEKLKSEVDSLKKSSSLDEEWHLGLAESQPLPKKVLRRIVKIQKIIDYLSIREVNWLTRFHQSFKKDKDLVHVVVCYSFWEIFSEITNTPLDTTKLDRELERKGKLGDFFSNLELGPYTKDAVEASFHQLRGLGSGKDYLNSLNAKKEN
jgi:hypothetical protein